MTSSSSASATSAWQPIRLHGSRRDRRTSRRRRESSRLGRRGGLRRRATRPAAGADILHCPSNFGPAVRLLPTVVTVHDVLPMLHPEWVPDGRSWGVQALTRATVRAASRIITDSEASATDIRALWANHPPIDVIPLGFDPPATPERESRVSERPYALAGGNRLPHKNFERLLLAWALISKAERPKLVITGSHGDDPLAPLVAALDLDDDVELLGWVAEDRSRRTVPRCFRLRLSVVVRGLRPSGARGDGTWLPGHRLGHPGAAGGRRRRRRIRRRARSGRDRISRLPRDRRSGSPRGVRLGRTRSRRVVYLGASRRGDRGVFRRMVGPRARKAGAGTSSGTTGPGYRRSSPITSRE